MVETIEADAERRSVTRMAWTGGDRVADWHSCHPPNALYPNRRVVHKGIEPDRTRLDVGIVHQWRQSPGPPHLHITSEARGTEKPVEPKAVREGVSWQDGGGIDTLFRVHRTGQRAG
ncbi:hypothetical protein [Halodesulfurarchaeum formicicum]|uniref:hypothetical protein n=1 Tax=Halodesulfurarchaeum formicicum TaxID=1873524 RepID=UPI0011DF1FBF|nr:hypothetical protein [Halodesulfurarchaeum formicicum]